MGEILEVDVPDAERGFMLVLQLGHGASLERDVDGGLRVHLEHPLGNGQLIEVLSTIERWLRHEGILRTQIRVGEETYRLIAS